jgi:hypothetical protein
MSTQVTINDTPPKTQITATAGQTVFTTNWTANAASDVVVYARTSSQVPDDLTQLVNSVNYTVAFIGGQEVVEVTFLVARAAGDVITITRDTPADRLNLYINTNFTPSMLNQDIGILTLVDQQAQLYNNQVAPHYNVSATPDLGDPMTGEGGDIYLPVLGANEVWAKNSANTEIVAIALPGSGVVSGLINQLAYYAATGSQVSGLATQNSSVLRTNNSGAPSWAGPMTNGQLLIGSTGSSPTLGTITGTAGVSVSVGAGTITISGTGSGIGWNEITGTTQTMAADQGYVTNNAGLVTLTLPTTAAFGTVINIVGKGAGGWKVAQNAGQNIQLGSSSSTVGVAGYIESTNQFDSIDLLCTTANTTWTAIGGPQGNITVA